LYVEHRYVCSDCNHLSPSLEDALLHQQHHLGSQYPQYHQHYQLLGLTTADYQTITLPTTDNNQYQCLECGQLLLTPGQLLEHQELHMKILQELPERSPGVKVTTTTAGTSATTGGTPARIHYECVECKALFVEQDLWLAHRQSHRAGGDTASAAVTLTTTTTTTPPQAGQHQALVDLEHSYRKPEEEEEEGEGGTGGGDGVADDTAATTVQLLLYECGECLQLFQTPKDFLEHQAAHLTSPAPPLNG
ncbi:ZN574 protein, partial [Zapornia atra]|nr:ZN574 protein [Zapornia atra]